jgi:transposase-like protein
MRRHALRAAELPSSGPKEHSARNPLRKPQSKEMLTTFINTLMSAEADAVCGAGHEQTKQSRAANSVSH